MQSLYIIVEKLFIFSKEFAFRKKFTTFENASDKGWFFIYNSYMPLRGKMPAVLFPFQTWRNIRRQGRMAGLPSFDLKLAELSWGNTKMQKSGDRKVLTGEDETDFKWAGEATGLMWEMLMPVSLPSNSHLKLGQIQLSLSFFGNAPIFPAWACRKETRFKLQSHWKYHCLYLPLGMSPNSKTPTQPLYVDCHVLDLIYDRTENL